MMRFFGSTRHATLISLGLGLIASGCNPPEPPSTAAPQGAMESGKMEPSNKMEPGKMEPGKMEPSNKMEPGKMEPSSKMEPGKMSP